MPEASVLKAVAKAASKSRLVIQPRHVEGGKAVEVVLVDFARIVHADETHGWDAVVDQLLKVETTVVATGGGFEWLDLVPEKHLPMRIHRRLGALRDEPMERVPR